MDYTKKILDGAVYSSMTEAHLKYLEESHPDIWEARPCPSPGLVLVELGMKIEGGVITGENPSGETTVSQTHVDRILVGEGECFGPDSRVRVEDASVYKMKRIFDPKVQKEIMIPNEQYVPPIVFGKTDKKLYVVLVTAQQISVIYEKQNS